MKKLILFLLVVIVFTGCEKSSNPVSSAGDNKPIYPQAGYNARNTSNPYAPAAFMSPVLNGALAWTYSFPGQYFSDGSEFCVDSKGHIYFMSMGSPSGIYKFSPSGQVLWIKDSLMQDNYCGISLSTDESKIYVTAYIPSRSQQLYCIDSSGKTIWTLPSSSTRKPVIGKSGTLYTYIDDALSAVSPNGEILWQNASIHDIAGKYDIAIDREDNIYTLIQGSALVKVNSAGSIVWQGNFSVTSFGVVIDGYGNIYCIDWFQNILYCCSPSGKLKWSKPNINNWNVPVITSDNKILATTGLKIIEYDTAGNQIWEAAGFPNDYSDWLKLDDNDNVYFFGGIGGFNLAAGSLNSKGEQRWIYDSGVSTATNAPPALLPDGKMILSPKRPFKIFVIN